MSDIHREFELILWKTSLNFGLENGNCFTTSYALQKLNREKNKRKGDTDDAIMGRIAE